MPTNIREIAFEQAIEHHLLTAGGYAGANRMDFDKERALDPVVLLPFIQETQPKFWKEIESYYGDRAAGTLLDDLCRAMDTRGSLDVIRHGFKCFGREVRVAYFPPAHGMNPDTITLYAANRLTITRQLIYSTRSRHSLDIVLSLNGIPVATMELKNPLTGQNVEHAKAQYMDDRDPRETIFEFRRRTLVHFAVDPDIVYMTTRLDGRSTIFLPFNRGNGTRAGNPENPGGYRTAYLWEEVLARDSFMDILGRFLHLQVDEKKKKRETMVFPRYHQLDSVRKLETALRRSGPGSNYLIEHSAGSGKSNSIGWLAHRLASLHDARDRKVFDSVIVITDRRVLDQQLQETIYQFEHRAGVVEKIDEDSAQLATAIRSGTPIIITTLQKFPYVTDKLADLPERRYAVIIDEAHSSQSGESAADVKETLAMESIRRQAREEAEEQGLPDYEEEILRSVARRGRQPNISFIAFTATPKYKTLEIFGTPDADGTPRPFHLYSMRQAIEEGFILDVLANYITYKSYFGLVKAIEDDPEVERKKAGKALARFMSLHPHNIAQKTEVMVEHFRSKTRHRIGGRAKAMVVTGSRLQAVLYKLEFDQYLSDHGYDDIRTLVAFSGSVPSPEFPNLKYTEVEMNGGIREKELPEKFASEEYHVLIVAEKFQTGFDQPLLHTMYVDKRLAGIQAVQTLSRLNRKATGKEDTFVLDFVNNEEEIHAAFKPYYETPSIGDRTDPRQLYDLQATLGAFQIYYPEEVEELCSIFFKPKERQSVTDQKNIESILNRACGRFESLAEETAEEFRGIARAFVNLYTFVAQIVPYRDIDLEKLYTYLRFLLAKLPRDASGGRYHFEDEVALKYYRLQKVSEGAIDLSSGDPVDITGPTEVGTGKAEDETVELSQLIDILNVRVGTEFKPADQLFFDQITADAETDETLRRTASANSIEGFGYVFDPSLEGRIIERFEQDGDIVARFLNDPNFRNVVTEVLRNEIYNRLRGSSPGA
ncbi:MAG: type I restriction endonuclease [Bacteroidota bacterium]